MDHNLPGLFAQRGRYVLVLAIDVHRLLFSLHIIAKGYTLLHVSLYYEMLLYGYLDLTVLYHLYCLIVYPIGSYFLQVKWKTWSGNSFSSRYLDIAYSWNAISFHSPPILGAVSIYLCDMFLALRPKMSVICYSAAQTFTWTNCRWWSHLIAHTCTWTDIRYM